MDKQTKKYRIDQFSNLKTDNIIYSPMIKIIIPESGQTKWLNISIGELEKIKEILTSD